MLGDAAEERSLSFERTLQTCVSASFHGMWDSQLWISPVWVPFQKVGATFEMDRPFSEPFPLTSVIAAIKAGYPSWGEV